MAIDPNIDVKNQSAQGGASWQVGGVLNIDSSSAGGKLEVDDVDVTPQLRGQVASITLTPAAGTTNQSIITIQALDGAGNAIGYPITMDVLVSDAASGAGLTAVSQSGAVACSGTGTDLSTMVSKKAIHVQTNATGAYTLGMVDSAKSGVYVVACLPGKKPFVSAALTAANYG